MDADMERATVASESKRERLDAEPECERVAADSERPRLAADPGWKRVAADAPWTSMAIDSCGVFLVEHARIPGHSASSHRVQNYPGIDFTPGIPSNPTV